MPRQQELASRCLNLYLMPGIFRRPKRPLLCVLAALGLSLSPGEVAGQRYSWGAQNPWIIESDNPIEIQEVEKVQIGFHGTYLFVHKPEEKALPYGPSSMWTPQSQDLQAVSGTAFIGARPWKGAELYYNAGFLYTSQASHQGGSSNPLPGDLAWPVEGGHRLHSPRLFFRQTFALPYPGNRSHENRPGHFNQLAGYDPINYIRIQAGKFPLGEVFDQNAYSRYPYASFLFWSFQQNGAWDRPQNPLGHSYALTAELERNGLNLRMGAATLPLKPGSMTMNWDLGGSLAGMLEIGHRYRFFSLPGRLSLMGFVNTGRMASLDHAIDYAVDAGRDPRLDPLRRLGQYKFGWLFHWEQALSPSAGLFLKAGWNNGRTETAYFVEVDQTLTLGTQVLGEGWRRPQDALGIGLAVNRISDSHRQFLAWGGETLRLGDQGLNYGDEFLGECFYRWRPISSRKIWIMANYRLALNPGYNRDRSMASWLSLKLDVEI